MQTNFDEIIDRRGTSCLKYDFAVERGYSADILPFWVADMDFRVPACVSEALQKRVAHGIFGYTQVKPDYAETLAAWFARRHDFHITREQLVITPGVVFAIATAIRAFTQKGDPIVIQPPVYYPFGGMIRQNARKVVNAPLHYEHGHYTMDFDALEKSFAETGAKLFIFCSPHNPAGRVWTRGELEQLATICERHQVLVVADEIHEEFVRQGHKHVPFANISDYTKMHTITCTAPSKTFNLAGLQLSNLFIFNEDLRKKYKAELSATGYDEPNTLGLTASQAAYAKGEPWLKELLVYLENNYQKTLTFLQSEMPKVHAVELEGTYLLWLDFLAYGLTPKEIDRCIIEDANLWLDSGIIFGKEGAQFQRINLACPWATLEKGLQNLARAFRGK